MLNFFEISAKITADDSEFKTTISGAESGMSSLGSKAVAMGQIMADAFEAVVSKVAEFGSKIVAVGMDQETAFAKVDTIMEHDLMKGGMALEDMQGSIIDLSNQMGISVGDLSDAVYNAISATGDTAGAVGIVEQATKLATGGFADTSSALGMLTTAMNVYGDSAGSITDISDKLMVVQNRGVTTVGELSSTMAKAMATAGSYNVTLDDLNASYISLTKQGIPTAESTTYLSAMINELGKDGTQVNGIIKEISGKTFGQMMSEGASLMDVLSLLSDSVGGDAEAMQNLWSSAEAGKASSAIMKQGVDYYKESLDELATATGTTETAFETMSDTTEHKMAVLKTNFQNMMGNLFTAIEPILSKIMTIFTEKVMPVIESVVAKITEYAPMIAEKIEPVIDTIVSVIEEKVVPAFTWIKENLNTIMPIIVGVAGAFMAFQVVSGIISAVSTAMGILNAVMALNPFVLVAMAIAGLVAGLIYLWNTNEGFREFITTAWENIKAVVGAVVDALVVFFTETIPSAVQAVIEFFQKIPEWWASLPEKIAYYTGLILSKFIEWITNLIAQLPQIRDNVVTAIVTFFSQLPSKIYTHLLSAIQKFTQWFTNMKNKVSTEVPQIISKIVTAFKELPTKMKEIGTNLIAGLWNGMSERFSTLLSDLKTKIQNIKDAFTEGFDTHSPSRWFKWLGEMNTEGFMIGMKDLLNPAGIANSIQRSLDSISASTFDSMGSGAIGSSAVYNQTINVNQQISTADELARRVRLESRYGLMKGVALG